MLELSVISDGLLMFSDRTRSQVSFPTDAEVERIVRKVCPTADVEVTQREPVSLVLRVAGEMSEVERARLHTHMEDCVSRSQFTDA